MGCRPFRTMRMLTTFSSEVVPSLGRAVALTARRRATAFAELVTSPRRRALTYDDLPNEIKGVIKDYASFTNAELRAAVKDYFQDKATCERRHGTFGTWDVGRVTDMSSPGG